MALEGARGGGGGVVGVLFVGGEGLRGLGERRLLHGVRAHLQHRSEVMLLKALGGALVLCTRPVLSIVLRNIKHSKRRKTSHACPSALKAPGDRGPTFGCEMAGGVPRRGLWAPALLCGVLIRGDT